MKITRSIMPQSRVTLEKGQINIPTPTAYYWTYKCGVVALGVRESWYYAGFLSDLAISFQTVKYSKPNNISFAWYTLNHSIGVFM